MTKKSGLRENHNRHVLEFSRRAGSYSEHNIIQKKVAQKLIGSITSRPRRILDLGCGSGAIHDLIDWEIESFTGIDKADQMCALHPRGEHITLLQADFEDLKLLKSLGHFDMVISSSALQWASNLPRLLDHIASMTDEVAFAIFCDGTFETIYRMTGMEQFLPKSTQLRKLLESKFACRCEIERYRLDFPNNISKFRYIKRSGVSGGERRLSVKETRRLIREYPHSYLEFEVLFCVGKTL